MSPANDKYEIIGPDSRGLHSIKLNGEQLMTPEGNLLTHQSLRLLQEIVKELEAGFLGPDAHKILPAMSTPDPDSQIKVRVVLSGSMQSEEYKEYVKAAALGPPWEDRRFQLSHYLILCFQIDRIMSRNSLVYSHHFAREVDIAWDRSLRNYSHEGILHELYRDDVSQEEVSEEIINSEGIDFWWDHGLTYRPNKDDPSIEAFLDSIICDQRFLQRNQTFIEGLSQEEKDEYIGENERRWKEITLVRDLLSDLDIEFHPLLHNQIVCEAYDVGVPIWNESEYRSELGNPWAVYFSFYYSQEYDETFGDLREDVAASRFHDFSGEEIHIDEAKYSDKRQILVDGEIEADWSNGVGIFDSFENFWRTTQLNLISNGAIREIRKWMDQQQSGFTSEMWTCFEIMIQFCKCPILTTILIANRCNTREFAGNVLASNAVLPDNRFYKRPRLNNAAYIPEDRDDFYDDERDYYDLSVGIADDASTVLSYLDLTKDSLMDIINSGEGNYVEFKSTLRFDLRSKDRNRNLQDAVLKEIVGFFNADGGDLIIGVGDHGEMIGIELDGFNLPDGTVDRDKYQLHLNNLVRDRIGQSAALEVEYSFHVIGNKTLLQVTCKSSDDNYYLDGDFYIRMSSQTIKLSGKDLVDHITKNTP